jgi:hypothetical protein
VRFDAPQGGATLVIIAKCGLATPQEDTFPHKVLEHERLHAPRQNRYIDEGYASQ